jgi:hypothetical protein
MSFLYSKALHCKIIDADTSTVITCVEGIHSRITRGYNNVANKILSPQHTKAFFILCKILRKIRRKKIFRNTLYSYFLYGES